MHISKKLNKEDNEAKNSHGTFIIRLLKISNKEKISKAARENNTLHSEIKDKKYR